MPDRINLGFVTWGSIISTLETEAKSEELSVFSDVHIKDQFELLLMQTAHMHFDFNHPGCVKDDILGKKALQFYVLYAREIARVYYLWEKSHYHPYCHVRTRSSTTANQKGWFAQRVINTF